MENGRMDEGQMDHGQWTMDNRLLTIDHGLC